MAPNYFNFLTIAKQPGINHNYICNQFWWLWRKNEKYKTSIWYTQLFRAV